MSSKTMLSMCTLLLFTLFVVAGCSEQTETQTTKAAPAKTEKKVEKVAAKKVNMEPGLWEMSSKMEAPGMPVSMPATTFTQCLTDEDFVPQGEHSGAGCEIKNLKINGGNVSYDLECSSGGTITTSNANITYSGTSMEGEIHMKVSGQASMEMTTKLSGKRIGPCK